MVNQNISSLEMIAQEFETHKDFAQCRDIVKTFESLVSDSFTEFE